LFERPRGGERAILVGVGIGHPVDPHDTAEFKALAASAGTLGVGLVLATRPRPDPKYFVGSGKAEEIKACADANDADVVLITSDGDVSDAVKMARSKGEERVVLFIQGGKGWEGATAEKLEVKAAEAAAAAQIETEEIEKAELPSPPSLPPAPADDLFGIPRDMLLPASIGVLAVSIMVVFTISRLTTHNHY